MDLLDVLKPFFDFFVRFCSVRLTLGGVSFTVGAFFLWCGLAVILINFIRGLGN